MAGEGILITRPEEDSHDLAARIEALGFEPVLCPLMTIVDNDAQLGLSDVGALAFTSANGVRAFARKSDLRSLPVFAVGAASAEAARDAGFSNVAIAGGDVHALAGLIAETFARQKQTGAILHIAGAQVAGDFLGLLANANIPARRTVLYEAKAATKLPNAVEQRMRQDALAGATFFSPRTARIFASIVTNLSPPLSLNATCAFCLSPAVENELGEMGWKSIATADAPTTDALVAAIGSKITRNAS